MTTLFGVVSLEFLQDADWRIALYAALSLTLVRMLPVALATAGMGARGGGRGAAAGRAGFSAWPCMPRSWRRAAKACASRG